MFGLGSPPPSPLMPIVRRVRPAGAKLPVQDRKHMPSAGQPNGRCGCAYPYSIGTPSSPSESRAAMVSNSPASKVHPLRTNGPSCTSQGTITRPALSPSAPSGAAHRSPRRDLGWHGSCPSGLIPTAPPRPPQWPSKSLQWPRWAASRPHIRSGQPGNGASNPSRGMPELAPIEPCLHCQLAVFTVPGPCRPGQWEPRKRL